ncbi:Fc.00g044780.m01.CDS01 [Cosmosporella sp. VM-42]
MKAALILGLAAGLIIAAPPPIQVPECSMPCILKAAKKISCNENDRACICGKKAEFLKHASPCVVKECSPKDVEVVKKGSKEICNK